MTTHSRRIRRCGIVMIEPREEHELDLAGLFSGTHATRTRVKLFALAPHAGDEIELDEAEAAALGRIGDTDWVDRDALARRVPETVIDGLLAKGLFIGDGEADAAMRERDETLRGVHWKPLSAIAHAFSRWHEAGVDEDVRITRHRTLTELIEESGPPPPHVTSRVEAGRRQPLPTPRATAIDAILARRATCRNFDTTASLDLERFGDVLKRVVGCQAEVEILPGTKALKKAHPSGGSLHPLEAYLVVQRIDGVAPGLYHYHVTTHALEPVATLDAAALRDFAMRCVAGQDFFADAHALVIVTARFERTFWKYRSHPKAYRAIVLEAGHVSQNLYLTATELGMGAFVTAAINEVDIERMLGLDALRESPIAVLGFGPRAAEKTMLEFDPLGTVWNGETLKAR
ncbi:MAG TPA: putative peptide maturation dehydrogenase [Rhodanobacteraceae bacterium]|nr:putative peptide maturation dehydrogenase [Rhodanobacteraceae bacterium]